MGIISWLILKLVGIMNDKVRRIISYEGGILVYENLYNRIVYGFSIDGENILKTSRTRSVNNPIDGMDYHRDGGPAIEWVEGGVSLERWWCNYGNIHRLDGPAIEWRNGGMSWYINGYEYTNFKDFQEAGGISDEGMMVLRLKYGEIGLTV